VSTLCLLLLGLAARPRLITVAVRTVDSRPAVVLQADAALAAADVRRTDGEVTVVVDADPTTPGSVPGVVPPIEGVHVASTPSGARVSIRVPHTSGVVLLFGPPSPSAVSSPHPAVPPSSPAVGAAAVAAAAAAAAAPDDLAALYAQLRPPPQGPDEAPPQEEEERDDTPPDGIAIGRLILRPMVMGTYVNAESAFLDDPRPVRDRYFEIRPQVGAELPIGEGRLTATYQYRLRREGSFAVVDEPTHLLDARLDVPVGTRLIAWLAYHFAAGSLEATEVDPGGEYFFGLGPFDRHDLSAGLRLELVGPLTLDLYADRNTVEVEDEANFFDYQTSAVRAGLGYEITPSLRAVVSYTFDDAEAPEERPEIESRAHSVGLSLTGEPLPLITGQVTGGYRRQRAPEAAAGGQRYEGFFGSASLTKEFTPTTTLTLTGGHNTQLSAFEDNAFYVSSDVQAHTSLGLPADFAFQGGLGYHWNDYRTVASAIGQPREDRIFAWWVGLSRPLTSWSWVRADYRRERRRSNLGDFEAEYDGLTVQLGLRLYRTR
jgi:hypothetical protein